MKTAQRTPAELIAQVRAVLNATTERDVLLAQALKDLELWRKAAHVAEGKLAESSNWQPIETAPSDQVVLLYSPDRAIGNNERIESRVFRNSRAGSQHAWATHWMPLPAGPHEHAATLVAGIPATEQKQDVAAALHHLQADGALDRGLLADVIRHLLAENESLRAKVAQLLDALEQRP